MTAALAASLAAVFVAGLPLVTVLWLRSSHLYRLSEERRADAEASLAQARGAVDEYLTTVSESTLLRLRRRGCSRCGAGCWRRRRRVLSGVRAAARRRSGGAGRPGGCLPRGSARSPARSGRGTRRSQHSAGPKASTRGWPARTAPAGRTRPSAAAAWRGWRGSRPTAAGMNRRSPHYRRAIALLEPVAAGRDGADPGPGRPGLRPPLPRPVRSCQRPGQLEEGERHLRRRHRVPRCPGGRAPR